MLVQPCRLTTARTLVAIRNLKQLQKPPWLRFCAVNVVRCGAIVLGPTLVCGREANYGPIERAIITVWNYAKILCLRVFTVGRLRVAFDKVAG